MRSPEFYKRKNNLSFINIALGFIVVDLIYQTILLMQIAENTSKGGTTGGGTHGPNNPPVGPPPPPSPEGDSF